MWHKSNVIINWDTLWCFKIYFWRNKIQIQEGDPTSFSDLNSRPAPNQTGSVSQFGFKLNHSITPSQFHPTIQPTTTRHQIQNQGRFRHFIWLGRNNIWPVYIPYENDFSFPRLFWPLCPREPDQNESNFNSVLEVFSVINVCNTNTVFPFNQEIHRRLVVECTLLNFFGT